MPKTSMQRTYQIIGTLTSLNEISVGKSGLSDISFARSLKKLDVAERPSLGSRELRAIAKSPKSPGP